MKKWKTFCVLLLEAVDVGKLEAGQLAAANRCDYLGLYIWLSLVSPKLETGKMIKS